MKDPKESPQEWAERLKKARAAKTPEQRAAEEAESEAWLASLPVLPPLPIREGETQVIFIQRGRKED